MSHASMLRDELETLYGECAAALDEADWDRWPTFFAETCSYKITTQENLDRGFPLALMNCESRGMMLDRVYAMKELQFVIPRIFRRLYSGIRIVKADSNPATANLPGVLHTQCAFAVFESRVGEHTTVFAAGRFVDVLCREGDQLKFHQRLCVLDSNIIPNTMPFPL